MLSAAIVALGLNDTDPIIGLIVTIVILRIIWQSFNTVRTDPGEPDDPDATITAPRMTIMLTRTTVSMPTVTRPRRARSRAERSLAAERLRAPASKANIARSARAELGRHARWAPVRAAVWELVEPILCAGARVAIVGAGNGDTVPIERSPPPRVRWR